MNEGVFFPLSRAHFNDIFRLEPDLSRVYDDDGAVSPFK